MYAPSLFLEHLHTAASLWSHTRASRDRLVRFQRRKLRCLARHAYDRVPLYRRLFDDAGVSPDDLRCAADLARLPITTKAAMRQQPAAALLAEGVNADRLILRYKTGSTGEPTRVRRSEREERLLRLFGIRVRRLAGLRFSDRTLDIRFRGMPTNRKPRSHQRLTGAIGILRSAQLDCLQSIDALAGEVRRFAPDVLAGYAAVIAEIAAIWPDLRERTRNPRLVVTSGEVLTPAMRQRIERGFETRILNVYVSSEFGQIGWECAVTGDFHLCDDHVVVEWSVRRVGTLGTTQLVFTANRTPR